MQYQNHLKIYNLLEIQQRSYNWTSVHNLFGSNLSCKMNIENIQITGVIMSSSAIKWVIVVNNDVVSFMINFMNKDRKTIRF